MPRRKLNEKEDLQVHIDKDPKNPDIFRTAEWTKDRNHSFWLSYYFARKQEIEAEEQFIKTGNPEFLRKARIYNHHKNKLIYEGINLEIQQVPYLEIEKEPTSLTIWPPRPPIELDPENCDKEEQELERIFGKKYSVVLRTPQTNKRKRKEPTTEEIETPAPKRKRTTTRKTQAAGKKPRINLIDGRPVSTGAESPKTNLSRHQRTKNAGNTPPPINTNINWRELPPITFNSTPITSHQPVREPSYLISPNLENNY